MSRQLKYMWSFPELRKLAAALLLVRLMTHVPLPECLFDLTPLFQSDPFLALFDIFSGGAAARFSILTLGVYPYLVARLLMPLVFTKLYSERMEEGEIGRERWNWSVLASTACMAWIMSSGYLYLLSRLGIRVHVSLLSNVTRLATLAGGTMLFLWLAHWLGKEGLQWLVGANVMVVAPRYLFCGIRPFVSVPAALDWVGRFLVSMTVVYMYLVLSNGERRIPVMYSRRSKGSLPVRFHMSGLTPLFYLLSVLGVMHIGSLLLQSSEVGWIRSLARIELQLTDVRGAAFWLVFFLMGVVFKVTFEMARFDGLDLSDQLARQGGQIPGIRPGAWTDQYLRQVYLRLAWPGAISTMGLLMFPALVCYGLHWPGIWPIMLISVAHVTAPTMSFLRSFEAWLAMHRYGEGFVR